MSIKIMTTTGQAANYDYGYTIASSGSSSSSSSRKPAAKPSLWENTAPTNTWQTAPQPQHYANPVNDYENATPQAAFPDPSGYMEHAPAPALSPTTAELSNASSYISYLVDQLNKAKDKLEKAEEKIKILESKDDSFKQYKEHLISSIDKFLAERVDRETISGKEIFERATE